MAERAPNYYETIDICQAILRTNGLNEIDRLYVEESILQIVLAFTNDREKVEALAVLVPRFQSDKR